MESKRTAEKVEAIAGKEGQQQNREEEGVDRPRTLALADAVVPQGRNGLAVASAEDWLWPRANSMP